MNNKNHSCGSTKKQEQKKKRRLQEKKWDKRVEETFPASDAIAKY